MRCNNKYIYYLYLFNLNYICCNVQYIICLYDFIFIVVMYLFFKSFLKFTTLMILFLFTFLLAKFEYFSLSYFERNFNRKLYQMWRFQIQWVDVWKKKKKSWLLTYNWVELVSEMRCVWNWNASPGALYLQDAFLMDSNKVQSLIDEVVAQGLEQTFHQRHAESVNPGPAGRVLGLTRKALREREPRHDGAHHTGMWSLTNQWNVNAV